VTHTILLSIHVAAGVLGLLLGPPTIAATLRGRGASGAGLAYQGALAVITTTAVGFAVLDWARWWPFVILAAGTEAAAATGWWVGRSRRTPGWHGRYIHLVCGSYISLVTALLVVSWGTLAAWLLPTVVGTILVERAAGQAETRALPA
jgi:hypothetical protein